MPVSYFRVVPGGRQHELEHATRRRFRRRSQDYRRMTAAVRQYLAVPSAANLRSVVYTLANWRASHPGDFQARCGAIWARVHGQLQLEVLRWGEFIECFDEIAALPTMAQALAWAQHVDTAAGLQQFGTYACLDATTFHTCINGDQTAGGPVRTREAAWNAGHFAPFGTNPAMALIPAVRSWAPGRLTVNYNRIRGPGGRGAVCTTFGYMAAHVLTTGRPNGPRVELVSYPRGLGSHVFVLVGRQGGLTAAGRIPNEWEAVVVDAWAAALGHPCIYANRAAFVFRGMTQNLQLVMQRPAA